MRLTEAVAQRLMTEAGTFALIGTRVYPGILPQDETLPAVAYTRISAIEDLAADGPTGLLTVRVQIDAYAADYDASRAVGDAIRAALHGWQDDASGVQFCALIPPGEQDLREDEAQSSRVSADYLVSGTEE